MAKENQKPTTPNVVTPNLQQAMETTQHVTWHPCTFTVDKDGDLVWQTPADVDCRKKIDMLLVYLGSDGESIRVTQTLRYGITSAKTATLVIEDAKTRANTDTPYLPYGAYTQDGNNPEEIIDMMFNTFNQQ